MGSNKTDAAATAVAKEPNSPMPAPKSPLIPGRIVHLVVSDPVQGQPPAIRAMIVTRVLGDYVVNGQVLRESQLDPVYVQAMTEVEGVANDEETLRKGTWHWSRA